MIGSFIHLVSLTLPLARVGFYMYMTGIDWSVIVVLRFTAIYCQLPYLKSKWRLIANIIIVLDVVQIMLNPFFGHAFSTVELVVDGLPYYSVVPGMGLAVHRVIAYTIYFIALGIVIYKTVTATKAYAERTLVIGLCMFACGLLETFYIFTDVNIDLSAIGFGFYGLLVFYFAIYYRPMRLLDIMFGRVVESMNAAVLFFDNDGACIYGNQLARQFILDQSKGHPPKDIAKLIGEAIGGWGGTFDQNWSKRAVVEISDEEHYLDVSVKQIIDDENKHVCAALTLRDVTKEVNKLEAEEFLATHDSLTGLYNERTLHQRTRMLLRHNPRTTFLAVAIDIKDFKIINDVYNNEYGDELLRIVASEIRLHARPKTIYGRINADRFAIFVEKEGFSAEYMEELLQSFGERATSFPIVAHMGIYEVTDRSLLPSVMYDRAFMAIKSIKNDFNNLVAVYDDTMREELVWTQTISNQAERAMQERQIRPYLQPLVNENGTVAGAEVLVRWIHPEEGFLSPERFVPIFEDNGMIARLDTYMWECACEILSDWADRGIDYYLSVNVSPKDFYFIDVFSTITGLTKKYDINPAKLRLEITESVMMTDLENRLRIIDKLRAEGFLVEMDDFGSGYSSLNMLKDIPVDVLKIDMMFLYKTKDQKKAETILRTIIDLSSQLGIPSITEGVETIEQLNMLVDMGCTMFQGYYFARPMPVYEFEELYRVAEK